MRKSRIKPKIELLLEEDPRFFKIHQICEKILCCRSTAAKALREMKALDKVKQMKSGRYKIYAWRRR